MGARRRVGIGLLYRPARLHSLAEFIPWNRFRGSIHVQKYQLWSLISSETIGGKGALLTESIESFIKEQAFSPSYELAPPPPALSRQYM
jgi:hypothetical protein